MTPPVLDIKEMIEIKEESEQHTLFDQSPITKTGFRLTKNLMKENSKIFGDLSKASLLHDSSLFQKKVIFYPAESESSLLEDVQPTTRHKRRLTNQRYNLGDIGFNKPKALRPMTAKTHYNVGQ